MNLNDPRIQAVREALTEAARVVPAVRKLLDGSIQPKDFGELAQACEQAGFPELAPLVRGLGHGMPPEAVLGNVVRAAGLEPILAELGQVAGDATSIVRAVKMIVRGV